MSKREDFTTPRRGSGQAPGTEGTEPEGTARSTVTFIDPAGPKALDPKAAFKGMERDVKLTDQHGICVMRRDGLAIAQIRVADFWPYWEPRLRAISGETLSGAVSPKGDIALIDAERIHAMTPAVARETAEMLRYLLDRVPEQVRQHTVGRHIAALAETLEQLIGIVEAGEHHTLTANDLGGGRA